MVEEEGITTKRRIFEEAVGLFAAKGFRGTSMRDLARTVGIKESSLYNHYAGKDAILEAVLDYQLEGLKRAMLTRKEMDEGVAGRTDPAQIWLQGVLDFYNRLPPLTPLINRILHNEMYVDERCRRFVLDELLPAQKEMTEILLGDLLAQGLIMDCDVPRISAQYVYMMHGLNMENTLMSLDGRRPEEVEANLKENLAFFLEGLKVRRTA